MKNATDHRQREEAVLMLCNFLRATPLQRIVKAFMSTIVHSLPVSSDVRLATAALEAIGDLCSVMRRNCLPYVNQLLPTIIANMNDKTALRKQEIAVRTLGQVVSATGFVVVPYLQYPNLLPGALELLAKDTANTPWYDYIFVFY